MTRGLFHREAVFVSKSSFILFIFLEFVASQCIIVYCASVGVCNHVSWIPND